ncbi:MAG: hypothetical protein Q7O66_21260 [Dehalococcoidia bacterium]|nr:hypothetical protein [Dehalococcoidia bacterium]
MSRTSDGFKPSNQTGGYDEARVALLRPIEAAMKSLKLPLLRGPKVGVILSALEVQIEDGGDSPEVNRLLLDALRASIRHQVSEQQAQAMLRLIDDFEQAETKRWDQIKNGTAPPKT